jgi:hypothetical protein
MVYPIFIGLGLLLASCSGDNGFSGGAAMKSQSKPDQAAPSSNPSPSALEEEEEVTSEEFDGNQVNEDTSAAETTTSPTEESTTLEVLPVELSVDSGSTCLTALDGDPSKIIKSSQGIDEAQLTPDSIIFLDIAGSKDITFGATSISKIKGICIEITGGAELTIDTSLSFQGIFYYGRGSASTAINFADKATLSKVVFNVSGENRLNMTGSRLSCPDTISDNKKGAAQVTCNGSEI